MTVESCCQENVKFDTITSFNETKSLLTKDLHRLGDFSRQLGLCNSLGMIEDVIKRLNQGTFTVAVVGEFKIGKSTFLNAILGASIFPADVLPTGARII